MYELHIINQRFCNDDITLNQFRKEMTIHYVAKDLEFEKGEIGATIRGL